MPARSEEREAEIGVMCFEDGGSSVKPRNTGSYQKPKKQGNGFPLRPSRGNPCDHLDVSSRTEFLLSDLRNLKRINLCRVKPLECDDLLQQQREAHKGAEEHGLRHRALCDHRGYASETRCNQVRDRSCRDPLPSSLLHTDHSGGSDLTPVSLLPSAPSPRVPAGLGWVRVPGAWFGARSLFLASQKLPCHRDLTELFLFVCVERDVTCVSSYGPQSRQTHPYDLTGL